MSKQVCLVAGETVEEQRKKMQTINIAQPSTNVIVQPPKVSQSKRPFFPVQTVSFLVTVFNPSTVLLHS